MKAIVGEKEHQIHVTRARDGVSGRWVLTPRPWARTRRPTVKAQRRPQKAQVPLEKTAYAFGIPLIPSFHAHCAAGRFQRPFKT